MAEKDSSLSDIFSTRTRPHMEFCDTYKDSSVAMANRILSYVAALGEVCERENLNPTFDVIRVTGPCHDPVFVVRGVAGDIVVEGTGQKKQTAKQHAAKQILLAMGELKMEDLKIIEDTSHFESAKVIGNVVDGENPYRTGPHAIPIEDGKNKRDAYTPVPAANNVNPLGDLIEMSMLMGWPAPRVVDEQKTGPAHDPRFTVSCYFSKFKTFATSRSKKEAKRLAALEMQENMRYQPDIMFKYSMRTGRPMNYGAVFADSIDASDRGAYASPVDFTYSRVPQILAIAESRTIDILKQLQSVDEIANPEVVLLNAVKECRFEVHFEVLCEDLICRPLDPPETAADNGDLSQTDCHPLAMSFSSGSRTSEEDQGYEDSDQVEVPSAAQDSPEAAGSKVNYTVFCVLRLPISTPIRLMGYGSNLDNARYSAAKNGLNYLRAMSLKEC